MSRSCKILVPSGCLGASSSEEILRIGLDMRPDAIAVDAGSTDSGPYYLGTGLSKMTRKAIKRDLRQLMKGRDELGIPLLIGSCGTCGSDSGVDWTAEICAEIAREEGLEARVALLYSELDAKALEPFLNSGRIHPLAPAGPLDMATLDSCSHIVALMGYEPMAAAVADGADIVLGGRTTDTAVLAAIALDRGLPPAAAWHAAKTAECGGMCTVGGGGGVMITIDEGGFEVEPLNPGARCTPYSVSAHLLYENSNPYRLKEPGIIIDATDAVYESIDDRRVRVTGTRAEITPYTMKLEGSGVGGYRTMSFTGIADPKVLERLSSWLTSLETGLRARIESTLGYGPEDYQMDFRPYGWNVLDQSAHAASAPTPREVGLMLLVSAATQEVAGEIARFCNPALLHFSDDRDAPVPSWAFPYSPAEVDMGPFYDFRLNHVVHVDDPSQLIRSRVITVGREAAHAVA